MAQLLGTPEHACEYDSRQGLTAGREAVIHRRAQTFKPGTREHASNVDLYLVQVSDEQPMSDVQPLERALVHIKFEMEMLVCCRLRRTCCSRRACVSIERLTCDPVLNGAHRLPTARLEADLEECIAPPRQCLCRNDASGGSAAIGAAAGSPTHTRESHQPH